MPIMLFVILALIFVILLIIVNRIAKKAADVSFV